MDIINWRTLRWRFSLMILFMYRNSLKLFFKFDKSSISHRRKTVEIIIFLIFIYSIFSFFIFLIFIYSIHLYILYI